MTISILQKCKDRPKRLPSCGGCQSGPKPSLSHQKIQPVIEFLRVLISVGSSPVRWLERPVSGRDQSSSQDSVASSRIACHGSQGGRGRPQNLRKSSSRNSRTSCSFRYKVGFVRISRLNPPSIHNSWLQIPLKYIHPLGHARWPPGRACLDRRIRRRPA